MSDLFAVINNAASSLSAQRAVTATASHNIDNASNASYARQTAVITAAQPAEQVSGAWIGRGAVLDTVTQARDRFVEAQLPRAFSDAARSSAESDALSAFHALDTGTPGGLQAALSSFTTSLTALAQNPNDSGLRTAAFSAAQGLATSFNRTASAIEAARAGLDASAAGVVSQVNTEAKAVAELNVQIAQASASGASPNDLLDLRQGHLDTLAKLVGATAVPTTGGSVTVMLPGGGALVAGGDAGTLGTATDLANGNHLGFTLQVPGAAAGQPTSLAASAFGGSLRGMLDARDGALADAGTSLDALARDVAAAVNTAHATGYGQDGVTGRSLFYLAPSGGAAATITVAPPPPATGYAMSAAQLGTSASGTATGDATAVNAMLAALSNPLAAGKPSAPGALSALTTAFGSATAAATSSSGTLAAISGQLTSARASTSGVSIDEEMITLQQAQRGFEAIAKVITTADQMLQTLLAIKP